MSTLNSDAGPSSAFTNSQDFIAFDFEDETEQLSETGQQSAEKGSQSRHQQSHSQRGSPKAQGKKRKADDDPSNKAKKPSSRRDAEEGGASARPSTSQSRKKERRQLARGTPWCVDVEFGRCRTAIEMLHDELIAFADWISPTREEHETRRLVIHLIRRAIKSQFPDADVQPFGSQNTQLYMPQGDIDLVVISPRMETQRREGVLRSMAACLRRHNLATDVQVIAKAKVPIIKFVCTHGKLKVDISVNQTNGLHAARFVCDWLDRCPSIRPLIMATKLLLSQRGMSEVFSGGLGSYSVICMVISHMQLHPKLQRGELDPALNLGVLFLEFLELFGKNFGYDEVGISVAGRGSYFRKASRGWRDDRRPFMLVIEDPQDAGNDISKGSFSILSVRQVFGGAFDILSAALCQRECEIQDNRAYDRWDDGRANHGHHKRFEVDEDEQAREALINGARNGTSSSSEKDPQSLLGTILGVNYEMQKARRDLESLWQSGSLQNKVGRQLPPRSPEPALRDRDSRKEQQTKPDDFALRDDPDSGHSGSHKVQTKGKATSRAEPEVIIDPTPTAKRSHQDSSGHSSIKTAKVHDVISISSSAEESGEESSNLRMDREEQGRADSRYDSVGIAPRLNGSKSQNRAVGKPSRLDHFSRSAAQTFVADDDEDEEASDRSSSLEAVPHPPTRSSPLKNAKKRPESKMSRQAKFWASKGNTVGGRVSSDEENGVAQRRGNGDGVMLNIHD